MHNGLENSLVEPGYQEHLDSLTPGDCGMLAVEMLHPMVQILDHQIRLETPGLTDREVDLRVAERL